MQQCSVAQLQVILMMMTMMMHHQEVWAGPSWSSFALKVRSLLLPGFQDPFKSVLLHPIWFTDWFTD
jgi:hypothetical protein